MELRVHKPDDYHQLMYYLSQFAYPSLLLGSFYATKDTMKLRNSFFLNIPARNKMKQQFLFLKMYLDDASKRYEKEKEKFQKIKLIEPLLGFGNALIDYKEGKVTIPEKLL